MYHVAVYIYYNATRHYSDRGVGLSTTAHAALCKAGVKQFFACEGDLDIKSERRSSSQAATTETTLVGAKLLRGAKHGHQSTVSDGSKVWLLANAN